MTDPAPAVPAASGEAPAGTPAAAKGEPAAAANADPLAPKPGERTFKVKVNGKEEIWGERRLIERAQKSEGAEAAMKRAAQMEQAFENFVSQSSDPTKLLALLENPQGLQYDEAKQEALLKAMLSSKRPSLVKAAKEWLYENEVEPQTLTPEQLKMRELEKFKTERERQDEAKKREEEQTKQQEEVQKVWNDYRVKIGNGLKAEGLPESEALVARIARKAQMMRRAGQPADIAGAVKMVKEEWRQEFIHLMTGMTEDQILSMYPEETLKTINKAFMKRLKGAADGEVPKDEGAFNTPRKVSKEDSQKNKNFWRDISRGTAKI